MGKGSKQRPTDRKKFEAEFDRIFKPSRKFTEVHGSSVEGTRKYKESLKGNTILP